MSDKNQQSGSGAARALTRARSTELIDGDPLSLYLAESRRYPLLSREEEHALAERYHRDGNVEAARGLVTGNLRLVVKIAMEYRRAWADVMDLIQEGNIGLAEAVKRFDPYRGVRFSSFARYWIRALILQFILKNFRLISFANTRAGRKLFFRLEKERNRLLQEHGEVSTRLLAEKLEVDESDIDAAVALRQQTLSLTSPRRAGDDESRSLNEVISSGARDIDDQVAHADLMNTVEAKLAAFRAQITDERERAIWNERLLSDDPAPLAALGERFGVSRERVRQIEARLKKRLRAYLEQELGESIRLDFANGD